MKLSCHRLLFTIIPAAVSCLHAAPGDVDSFNAPLWNGFIHSVTVQPDGAILIAGDFIRVHGVSRRGLARLHPDGSLDQSFDPRVNYDVHSMAVQPDGKVLIGGEFEEVAGTPRQYIARLHPDGSLDAGFDPNASAQIRTTAVQPDGSILLGGWFRTLQPNGAAAAIPRYRIARLHHDGLVDESFDPQVHGYVDSIHIQENGKVLLGGNLGSLWPHGAGDPFFYSYLARLNPDGSVDAGFNPEPSSNVWCFAEQPDGKLLLGGQFTSLKAGGSASAVRRHLARVHADGTLDTSFHPGFNDIVMGISLQADGKIIVCGFFTEVTPAGSAESVPRKGLARLMPDGTLDASLDFVSNDYVVSAALQADGRILLGGGFSIIWPPGAGPEDYVARERLARIHNDAAVQTLTVPDATRISRQRGGAAPEVARVTFELKPNGSADWIPLGRGVRVGTSSHWTLTGLSLPPGGEIRARGVVTSGGFGATASGMIGQTIPFSFPADGDSDGLPDDWELAHWSTTSGHAALDDSDRDGYSELLEFALGLNPAVPDAGGLPGVVPEAGFLTMTLTKIPGVSYTVESAGRLHGGAPDSFSSATTTVLVNDATTLKVRDNTAIGAQAGRFMRLRVTAALQASGPAAWNPVE